MGQDVDRVVTSSIFSWFTIERKREVRDETNHTEEMKSREIIAYMESLRNEEQREVLMRFFKTGLGEYGYGDEFLGLKVPQTREIVKAVAKETDLSEVP